MCFSGRSYIYDEELNRWFVEVILLRAPFQILAIPYRLKPNLQLSNEHNGFEWLTYDEAITRLTWDSNKTALYELNCRLLEAIQIGGLEG